MQQFQKTALLTFKIDLQNCKLNNKMKIAMLYNVQYLILRPHNTVVKTIYYPQIHRVHLYGIC